MIWMALYDGKGPVDLFHQHQTKKLMGEREGGKGNDQVCFLQQEGVQALAAANEKGNA